MSIAQDLTEVLALNVRLADVNLSIGVEVMQVKQLEIWDYKEEIDRDAMMLCLLTNGDTNKLRLAIMGKGVARQAKNKYTGLAALLGQKIITWGNAPYGGLLSRTPMLYSFPTKYHWRDTHASLELIKWSTQALNKFIRHTGRGRTVLLPRPGCGNGKLNWEDIEPIVSILPENVWLVTNGS